jgi:Zn-finger nucleic acid-binding protein
MPSALSCPKCLQPLEKTTTAHGIFWSCASCGGKALGVDVLRRTFVRDQINEVWRRAREREGSRGRACPSCSNAMIEVAATTEPQPRIDVCRLCHFLWFDHDELTHFTLLTPPPEPVKQELSPEAREQLALIKVQILADRAQKDAEAESWRKIIQLFGW